MTRRKPGLFREAGSLLLAPAVAAARLASVANRSARGSHDPTFWLRMAGEKAFAAQQAWWGAAGTMVELQQRWLAAWLRDVPSPWPSTDPLAWWKQRQADAEAVAAATLAPVARRVRRNARRPGR